MKKKKAGTARRHCPTGRRGSRHDAKRRTPTCRAGRDPLLAPDEAAVLIQFVAEAGTARRFGLPGEHRHA